MVKQIENTGESLGAAVSGKLEAVQEMIKACIQCGTCSGSCPNAFAMDYTPRHLWRLVLMGRTQEVFQSQTFTLCSACYYCTLRCPRGLPLTEAMASLKQIAAQQGLTHYRRSNLFYQGFMQNIRRNGRVREMTLMALYFARLGDPLLPVRFAPLGLKLMLKGKISLQMPSKGDGKLEALFRKAEEIEG